MSKRGKEIEQIGPILKRFFKRLGIETQILERQIPSIWPEIVGRPIANHTKVKRVKDGFLFVKTDSPSWANELTFLKGDIIKRLNERIGKRIIKDLRLGG